MKLSLHNITVLTLSIFIIFGLLFSSLEKLASGDLGMAGALFFVAIFVLVLVIRQFKKKHKK